MPKFLSKLFLFHCFFFFQLFDYQIVRAQETLQNIGVPVVSRKAWGCPEPYAALFWKTIENDVSHVVIHHSAGNNYKADWREEVQNVWEFHTLKRRWNDIGYNYLIDPNGVVYEGRAGGDYARGAHLCSQNENKLGICLLGNYERRKPSKKALETLIKVIAWKCVKDSINPSAYLPTTSRKGVLQCVAGHRDGCGRDYTDCPGDSLYSLMNFIRLETEQYCAILEQKRLERQFFETILDKKEPLLTIKPELPLMIRFYNALGKVVLQSVDNPVNIENLDKGVYLIKMGTMKMRFVKTG
jgi:hypothetical protein